MTAAGPQDTGKPAGLTLTAVTELLSALAALAGLIYVTGGVVLALRLAFAGLPALGVVGQLPNTFLFSIGASQVVMPALVISAFHVIYVAYRRTPPAERPSVWATSRMDRGARRRHLTFAAVVPGVLVLPGAFWALQSETRTLAWISLVAAAAAVALCAHRAGAVGPGLTPGECWSDEREPRWWIVPRYYLWVAAGGLPVALVAGLGIAVTGDWGFGWLLGAWALCVPAVLGYLLLRGKRGDAYRDDVEERHLVRAQIELSLALAALTIPALVCFWGAWALEPASVCANGGEGSAKPSAIGEVLVGETGDRVYVGAGERIVSIPQGQVVRTVIGDDMAGCP